MNHFALDSLTANMKIMVFDKCNKRKLEDDKASPFSYNNFVFTVYTSWHFIVQRLFSIEIPSSKTLRGEKALGVERAGTHVAD